MYTCGKPCLMLDVRVTEIGVAHASVPTSHKICCIGLAVDVDDLGYYSFVMRINVLYR